MIPGPEGSRMLCSSQPNKESARAPTRIFVWRQSFRVGVRADGTDPYGKSEPLQGARGGPHRRRVPAAQGSRRRETDLSIRNRRHGRIEIIAIQSKRNSYLNAKFDHKDYEPNGSLKRKLYARRIIINDLFGNTFN